MSESTYKVEGMTCAGCVASVSRALGAALPGVELDVDLEGGLVHIRGEHDQKAVEEAVKNAGFEFGGRQ